MIPCALHSALKGRDIVVIVSVRCRSINCYKLLMPAKTLLSVSGFSERSSDCASWCRGAAPRLPSPLRAFRPVNVCSQNKLPP